MKKIFLILTCVCFFSAVTASAQQDKILIGVKGGLNVPNLTTASDNPLSDGWSSKLGGIYGLTFEYRFNTRWSLVSGIEYTEMGGKKDGMQALPSKRLYPGINAQMAAGMLAQMQPMGITAVAIDPWTNKYTYADFSNKSEFNYLQVPVMGRFSLPFGHDRFRFVVHAGGYAAYMLEAKNINTGTSALYADDKKGNIIVTANLTNALGTITQQQIPLTQFLPAEGVNLTSTRDIYDDTYHFNFGFIGGAGVGMKLWKGELMLQAGGQYGFVKIQKSDENGQNRIGAGSFTLGYAFAL